MIYRIRFEPKGGFFVVEIGAFGGLVWRKVQEEGERVAGLQDVRFENLSAAKGYCKNIGLEGFYRDVSAGQFSSWITAPHHVAEVGK